MLPSNCFVVLLFHWRFISACTVYLDFYMKQFEYCHLSKVWTNDNTHTVLCLDSEHSMVRRRSYWSQQAACGGEIFSRSTVARQKWVTWAKPRPF